MTERFSEEDPSDTTLAARRQVLQMSVADVADRLLLSQKHVLALEANDPSAFYNPSFYAQALQRYRALLGLETPPAAEPQPVPEPEAMPAAEPPAPPPVESPTPSTPHTSPPATTARTESEPSTPPTSRSWLLPLVVVLGLALGGILMLDGPSGLTQRFGTWVGGLDNTPERPDAPEPETAADAAAAGGVTTNGAADSSEPARPPTADATAASSDADRPQPAPPVAAAPSPPPALPATAAARTPGRSDPDSLDRGPVWEFEATSLSWVFARDASGRETEVTLKPGDRVQVRGRLTYLAIGDAAAITVRIDGTERDLSSLPRAGRAVRIRGPELDALR